MFSYFFMMMPDCHWRHFANISNSAGLWMGTVVNIAGMGTGLERQHEGMGRAWELDVRGWGGDGNECSGSGVGAGLQLQPRAKLYNRDPRCIKRDTSVPTSCFVWKWGWLETSGVENRGQMSHSLIPCKNWIGSSWPYCRTCGIRLMGRCCTV